MATPVHGYKYLINLDQSRANSLELAAESRAGWASQPQRGWMRPWAGKRELWVGELC